MKAKMRTRGRLTEAVTLLAVLGGLSISWVSNAAGPDRTITLAGPAGSASTTAKAPAPVASATTSAPPSAAQGNQPDAPSDPCMSGQVDQRVKCVAEFSEKLAAVCREPDVQGDLTKLAKAAFARLPKAERDKRLDDADKAMKAFKEAGLDATKAEAEAGRLESAAKGPAEPAAPSAGEAAKGPAPPASKGKGPALAPAKTAAEAAADAKRKAVSKREDADKAKTEAAKKQLLVDMADTAADATTVKAVCTTLCPNQTVAGADGSLCDMANAVQNAAVVSAWDDVLVARAYVASSLSKVGTLRIASKEDLAESSEGRLQRDVASKSADTAAGFDTVGIVTTALQGLAKFVVDRAKAEAIGWFLDRMGSELCGTGASTLTLEQREIKAYWLPQVCTLAESTRLSAYGGGGAMLDSLRSAIEADVQGWPGAAASLVPADIYRVDAKPAGINNSVDCSGISSPKCESINKIRTATQLRITEMLKGRDPLVSLHDLSTTYRAANGMPAALKSANLQATACGLGLPHDVNDFAESLTVSLPEPADRLHAAMLAALVNVPACNDIVARKRSAAPELTRLNTLLLLQRSIGVHVVDAEGKLRQLNTALKELREATAAFVEASKKLADSPPPALPDEDDAGKVLDAVRAFEMGRAEGALNPARQRLARALIAVADAGIGLSQSGTQVVKGFCDRFRAVAPLHCPTPPKFAEVEARLEEIRHYITVAGDAAAGDWAKASISVLAALHQTNTVHGATPTTQKLLRYAGLLAAIVNARTSDDVAKAIDEVANPVGGWKAKGIPNTRTVSLSAHAGLFGALEVRHGTYGAQYEDWAGHFQAPALALPIGLEVSSGYDAAVSPVGLFIPLIDPAAFLQYDAERDGKLPGASLKTALSPGIGLRLGIKDTPFSIMPMVVYRPGFRQWDSKLTGTGADALQAGILLDVDVTLFQFAHWEKDQ